MYIEFEGVTGTWYCGRCGVLGDEVAPDLIEGGLAGELVGGSNETLLATSDRIEGHGGGKGDTETEVTEAEWA